MTAVAPTGTVTLLFTDIEGSTRLLDRLGDGYAGVLRRHHGLVRAAVAAVRRTWPPWAAAITRAARWTSIPM